MSNASRTRWNIPQRLDEPSKILFLTVSEFALFFVALFFGLMIDKLVFCLLLAGVAIAFKRKFAAFLSGLSVTVLIYWFLGLGGKGLLPSWMRYWRG
jgi:type IV conjugative transfer system protein TraL